MIAVLKSINLGLAFFLELAMLAAFAFWGFQTGKIPIMKFLLGIGIPLVVAVIWGIFMAPKSSMQLQGAAYFAVKLMLFSMAAVALYATGRHGLGIALAVAFVINTVLLYVWK